MKARSPSAWKIPVSLVRAPDFNATLVRAMAAGDSSEKRKDDIADPLGYQLLVAVQPDICHFAGAGSAQQTFDHSQHGDTDGWSD